MKPIIFSAPMVRALLDGTKTQTRRVVKPQPWGQHYLAPAFGRSPDGFTFGEPGLWRECGPDYPDGPEDERRCPYGVVGDRLWVRETFTTCTSGPGNLSAPYRADPMYDTCKPGDFAWNWTSPIFMPRWASRITLEITDVRVQRVLDISEADAIAEGVMPLEVGGEKGVSPAEWSHIDGYARLWDAINAKRAPWSSNPWVWAITFRRHTA